MLTEPQRVLVTIALSVLGAQLIKMLIIVTRHREQLSWKDLFVTGGMPSSHSALVAGMSLILYLVEGFGMNFLIMLAFALIVLRDAMGVRRTVGEEGQVLNEVIRKAKLKLPQKHYALGHTPAQVVVGVVVGLAAALVAFYL